MGLRFQLLFIFSFVCLFVPHPPVFSVSIFFFYGFAGHRAANCPQLFLFFSSADYYYTSYTLGQDWEGKLSCLDTEHQPRNSRVNVFLTRWSNPGRQVDPEVVDFIPGLMHWCLQNTSSCLNVCLQKYVWYRVSLSFSIPSPSFSLSLAHSLYLKTPHLKPVPMPYMSFICSGLSPDMVQYHPLPRTLSWRIRILILRDSSGSPGNSSCLPIA